MSSLTLVLISCGYLAEDKIQPKNVKLQVVSMKRSTFSFALSCTVSFYVYTSPDLT